MPSNELSQKPNFKRAFQLLAGFGTLFLIALAVGCTGFFVNPTLTSIAVTPPTPNVTQGATQQMTAFGTFDNNQTKTLTSNLFWSTSDMATATISQSGVLTGVSPGSVTVTATSANISGTTTATISIGNVTGITINPTTATITPTQTQIFNALATIQNQGGTLDVSSTASWTASPSGIVSIDNTSQPGAKVTVIGTITQQTIVTITATYISSNNTFTANAKLTINP